MSHEGIARICSILAVNAGRSFCFGLYTIEEGALTS